MLVRVKRLFILQQAGKTRAVLFAIRALPWRVFFQIVRRLLRIREH